MAMYWVYDTKLRFKISRKSQIHMVTIIIYCYYIIDIRRNGQNTETYLYSYYSRFGQSINAMKKPFFKIWKEENNIGVQNNKGENTLQSLGGKNYSVRDEFEYLHSVCMSWVEWFVDSAGYSTIRIDGMGCTYRFYIIFSRLLILYIFCTRT